MCGYNLTIGSARHGLHCSGRFVDDFGGVGDLLA